MKTLKNVVTIVKDGRVTITADISEKEFSQFLVQRVTIGHLNPENLKHPRHVQISDEAVFVKAFGNGFAVEIDDIVSIACVVEPKTSFAPAFKYSTDPLTIEISSELDPNFQWQVSDKIDKNATWSNVEGETSKTFNKDKVKYGQFVRCIASSDAGSMASNPVKIQ